MDITNVLAMAYENKTARRFRAKQTQTKPISNVNLLKWVITICFGCLLPEQS